jgi:hypothetical protein
MYTRSFNDFLGWWWHGKRLLCGSIDENMISDIGLSSIDYI